MVCDKALAFSRKRIYLTEEDADKAMALQEFKCAGIHGKKCPQGIAKLIIANAVDPSDSGLCSGFLVGPRTLVTNHHCISTPKECKGTRVAIYNGIGYENARCKRIISAKIDSRSENRRTIDFSVIELTHEIKSSKFFYLSTTKLRIGDKINSWVIDHFSPTKSRITQLPCFLKDMNRGLELSNCASISGNSGSPVVNMKGGIVGTLWAGDTEDYVTEETPLEERRNTNAISYVTDLEAFRSHIPQ
jgi:hypothetical protein